MADNASRRGAANLGVPLMIVAFLVMAVFLYWLNLQAAQQATVEVAEDTTGGPGVDIAGATTISAMDLQTDPAPFEGQLVRVAGLSVASLLGEQGFWLELPNRNPFLVSMSEAAKAQGVTVTAGQTAVVVGTIYAMGDSVLTAWSDAGTIGEGDRLAAEFATHYLEAAAVKVSGGSTGSTGSGTADGGGG